MTLLLGEQALHSVESVRQTCRIELQDDARLDVVIVNKSDDAPGGSRVRPFSRGWSLDVQEVIATLVGSPHDGRVVS